MILKITKNAVFEKRQMNSTRNKKIFFLVYLFNFNLYIWSLPEIRLFIQFQDIHTHTHTHTRHTQYVAINSSTFNFDGIQLINK